jgi:hypothetical protein
MFVKTVDYEIFLVISVMKSKVCHNILKCKFENISL